MVDIRKIVRKCLFNEYMAPPKSKGMGDTNYSDMSLKELRDKLADAEEQMINANPQMHLDHMWSKWMRERMTALSSEIRRRTAGREVKESYVDTSWSRQGLEPNLKDTLVPLVFPNQKMMGPGDQTSRLVVNEAGDSRTISFTGKNNPRLKITIKVSRDGRISEIENEMGLRFPYSIGQHFNRGMETWACNNNFFMDGKDTCPEKKIFGVRVSDVPQGHEWRLLYPGKFR